MLVHRANTCCPVCNTSEEVWFYNSEIKPFSIIDCKTCSTRYKANDYIISLLDLYKDVTVSVSTITDTVTL